MSDNYPNFLKLFDGEVKAKNEYIKNIQKEFEEVKESFLAQREVVKKAKMDWQNNYKKYEEYKAACTLLDSMELDLKEKTNIINSFNDNSETYDIDYASEQSTKELKAIYDAYEDELQGINKTIQDSTAAIIEAKNRYIAITRNYNMFIKKSHLIRNGAPNFSDTDKNKPQNNLPTKLKIENSIYNAIVKIKSGSNIYIP